MRLIDADEAYKVLTDNYHHRTEIQHEALKEALSKVPTIDAVKHGHWDNKIIDVRFDAPHTVARCSVCKGKIWVYAENYVVRYPYCPLCGAKMDEVEE